MEEERRRGREGGKGGRGGREGREKGVECSLACRRAMSHEYPPRL